MNRNLKNRQKSTRTLTLYPKQLLNIAGHAHDAKDFSALDYGPVMTSPAVAVMLKNPTVKEAPFGFEGAEGSAGVFAFEPVKPCNVFYVEACSLNSIPGSIISPCVFLKVVYNSG